MDSIGNSIELIATGCGILYVVLMTRQSVWCWLFGNLSVGLMSYSCYHAHLYADMVLQWMYFVIGVVGFVRWKKGVDTGEELCIRRIIGRDARLLLVASFIVWMITAAVLLNVSSSRLPLIDSLLFAASLAATWLQAYKYLENWYVWVPVNIAYALVYGAGGLWAYVVLSLCYAALSVNGFRVWKRSSLSTAQ